MATRRSKSRETRVLSTDFRVPLSDVVDVFVDSSDTEAGDTFSARSIGDQLVLTRHRRTVLLAGQDVFSPGGRGRRE